MSFILENVMANKEKENIDYFTDLLSLITREKKMTGYLSEQEICDIQICDSFFVILLACGSLILYDESGKHNISKRISSFGIRNEMLTAIRYDNKILTGSLQELKNPSKSSADAAFSSVSDLSRRVGDIGEMLTAEQSKLDHIRIFSAVREEENIFDIQISIEQEHKFPVDSQHNILVALKLIGNEVKIKEGFFLFKFVLKTRSSTIERTIPVPSMSQDDTLHSKIPLEDLSVQDFPLYLEAFLVLQEGQVSEGSLGFIYSEKLFHKELSPLEFLSTKLIGEKQNENPQIYQGSTGSERDRFVSLLETEVECSEQKQFSSRLSIPPETLDQHPKLSPLTSSGAQRVVFTLLQKDIEFLANKEEEATDNETRDWTVTGCKDIVTLVIKYLNKV